MDPGNDMLAATKREDLPQGYLATLAAAGTLCRAYFTLFDVLRRGQANVLDALGLGAQECSYEIVESGPYWHLRDYPVRHKGPSLLVVAAPIKQPYIWDLAPSASAIRYLLNHGLHVHLLEWLPERPRSEDIGVDEYVGAISQCCAKIAQAESGMPFLIGHSLGGTLAAISAAMSERIRGLILLGTPLCFAPGTSQFRDALVALVTPILSDTGRFPGSLLSYIAGLAAPRTFIWSRIMDALFSAADDDALITHGRVERWTLDEMPLPGRAADQIMRWLYRENRFCAGTLKVGDRFVGPFSLSTPMLAVVNMADDIAPLASIKPCVDAMPTRDVRIIEYPGETGVGLQHVGVLLGHKAYAEVWPEIISWLKDHSREAF
jgi:polyhydroxyalkanoate synthase